MLNREYQEVIRVGGNNSSNNNVIYEISHPNVFDSRIDYSTNISSNNRETVSFSRSEFIPDFEFKNKGRYTSQVLSNMGNMQVRSSVVASNSDFNFDSIEANYCKTHSEIKDYILMSKVNGYKVLDTICKNCLSHINHRNPNPARADLFDTVILDNKDKILQIRQNKLNISGNSGETLSLLKDTILPLADELIYLSEVFNGEVCGKINGNSARAEEVAKLKNFISSIELDSNGDPNLNGIGRNEELKHKYIKLALFLVNFTGISNDNTDQRGMTESLKSHMVKIIALRKVIIARITSWLKHLAGGFFDYIHNLEGLPLDENFRKNLQIDYVNEEEILKLKIFFEGELKKRDDRIRLIEDENQRYKREIESLRTTLLQFTEQEKIIVDLKARLQKAEADNAYHKQTITSISSENQRLNTLNVEYLTQIDNLRKEISHLKLDFEGKMRNTIETMKVEYENKIGQYVLELNQIKVRYAELENKYNIEIRGLTNEKEQFLAQIKLLNSRYENDIKALNERYDALSKEYGNIKITLNNHFVQINQLGAEKINLEKTVEGLRLQISSYESEIKNLNITLQGIFKERDDLRNQTFTLRADLEKQKNEFTVITNIKVSYESRINELQKKLEELSGFYAKLQNEYNLKITVINNLEIKLKELGGVVSSSEGQIGMYINTIKKYEESMMQLKKENDELKIKLLVISEKDSEISRLKLALSSCRDEWTKLSESYEGLLVDIRNQISVNEALRVFIYELQSKIENHNQQVGGLDSLIKQQLEILTRQTLSKKSIEYSQSEAVRKSQNEMDALRVKLGRIESSKLTKSAVFSNISISLDNDNKKPSNNNVNVHVIGNNKNLVSATSTHGNSGYSRYYVDDDSNLRSTNNLMNTNSKIVSSSNDNLAYANNNNYTNSVIYETRYVDSGNNNLNNNEISYNYKGTYDRSYGANVFNNVYGSGNSNTNIVSSSNPVNITSMSSSNILNISRGNVETYTDVKTGELLEKSYFIDDNAEDKF